MNITTANIAALRSVCKSMGEDCVTLSTSAGVITFRFHDDGHIHARSLPFESQPTRQQLTAMIPLAAAFPLKN